MSEPLLRALIVEDEPPGYERLVNILQRLPDVEVVGWAKNVKQAVKLLEANRPNVVLLDIQMPDGSGVDLVRKVGPRLMPKVIFVTAHDRHAVQAFDMDAVDYVLKPFTDERITEALERVRRDLTMTVLAAISSRLDRDAERDQIPAPSSQVHARQEYLSRISVFHLGKLLVIPLSMIDRMRADGVYVEICVGRVRYILRESLSALEEKLDPNEFCRIHRSEIVALGAIESYIRSTGRYQVQLKSGVTLPVGRSRRKELERRLGCL